MAIQHELTAANNSVGVALTEAYTIVENVSISKAARYDAPESEGGAPTLRVKHTLNFDTYTYSNKAQYDAGKQPVAENHYIEDYPLTYSEANTIAYSYEWLKDNVSIYASATDV